MRLTTVVVRFPDSANDAHFVHEYQLIVNQFVLIVPMLRFDY